MYNKSQNCLGISSKVYKVVHKIALIAILHSTLIAPSQNLMHEYYKIKTAKVNKGYAGDNALNSSSSNNLVDNSNAALENNKSSVVAQKQLVLEGKTPSFSSKYFYSDVKIGSIGKTSKVNFDDPSDNVFNIYFDKKQLVNSTVFLKYKVYGIDPKSMPSKSINSTYVTGGYAYKESNQWSEVVEEIDSNWLQNGRNSIFFSIPENSGYTYKVKDVTVFTAQTKSSKNQIVLNNDGVFIKKDNKLYINGFFKKSKTEGSDIKVIANNQELKVFDNKFENFIDFKDEKFVDLKVFQNGILIAQDLVSIDKVIEADKLYTIENKFVKKSKFVNAFSTATLEVEGAKLSVLESSLVESKEISISMLRAIDIAPLESGFINVTKDKKAFRFLPDGTKFAKPVKIEIEYDEKLIPMGYTPKDIKTFYFDIQHKKWIEVAKDSVDVANKKVVSSTTHFTDYINGIIQSPESPQTSAFTPTMMNDVKSASPESQIALISPPEVSQKGGANVSYPIKLPAGRNGMQPQVAIQYSSDGGNGWLGEGWGISAPAITLDTRWGVPVFDSEFESEIYNLNGEQLMYPRLEDVNHNFHDWMPNRHFGENGGYYSTQERIRITDAKFTFRKQGDFSKIERKGLNPSSYYWKVTSTDGTISWYGGKNAIDENAVIRNAQGNIVQWSLHTVEDVYTNTIKYNYTSQLMSGETGNNANLNTGLIYNLNNIVYTGHDNTSTVGKYKVEFINETKVNNVILRQDISINSRLGVKQITPFRLDQIKVSYDNSPIRSYKLEYGTGKFGKSLLTKVIENDAAGTNFYEHTFEYYDDIATNNNTLFGESVRVAIPKPNVNYLLGFGNLLNPSRINTNQSEDKSFDFRPSIGIEFKRKTNNKFKTFTIGFPFSYNWSKDKGKMTLADINGDGLDDLVYQTSNGLKFRPHYADFSTHTFGDEMNINDIGNFYNGNSKTTTRFLPFDIAFGKKWRKYVSWKKLLTKSYTDVYFADGNGDGLADIVKDNKVYFNTLNSNGEPTFQTSSSTTPNMVITATAVAPPPIDTEGDDDDAFLIENTDYDLVKVWVAPQQHGLFIIEDSFSFTPSSPDEKVVYSIETKDYYGEIARLYLKEFSNATGTQENIYIDHYNAYDPDLGFSEVNNHRFYPGQKFYFRVHKNTPGTNPIVNFDPKVRIDTSMYTGTVDTIDENNIDIFENQYSNNFILSSKDDFELPSTGTIAIEWPDFNASELSDDVTFKIIKVSEIGNTSTEQVVYQKACPQNTTTLVAENTNDLAFNVSNLQYSTIGQEEEIYFYATVTSDSNVRWKDIEWKLKFTYTPDANAIAQEEEFETMSKYVIADYSIYKPEQIRSNKFQIRPQDAPNQSFQYWFKIKTDVVTGYNQLTLSDNGKFTVVFKRNGQYFAKRQVQIINGAINVSNNNDPINFFNGNVHTAEQDKISIEIYANSNEDLNIYKKYSLSVQGVSANQSVYGAHILCGYTSGSNNIIVTNATPYVFVKDYNDNLGPLYNGWGQFFYNDTIAADISNTLPSDGYSQLINTDIIDNPSLQYSGDLINQLGCSGAANLDDCINNQIYDNLGLPSGDFTDGNTDDLEDSFYSENGEYDGAFSMPKICFLPARPYRTFESSAYIEKWMGLFNNNFSSATQGQVGNFDESMFADTPTEVDENVLFPPQQLDLNTGMYSITKFHKSLASSKTYGAGPFNVSKSNTTNGNKYSTTKQDFFDLNGDSYPEIFTDNSLNYTNMTGGHKPNVGNLGFGAIVSNSTDLLGTTLSTNSLNAGDTESLSCPGIIVGAISLMLRKPISINRTGFGKPSASMGINANLSGSNSGINFWQDVNGDGLADRVKIIDGQFKVQFNKGYLNNGIFSEEAYSGLNSNTTTPGPGINFGFSPASLQGVYDQVSGLSGTGFDLNLSINFGVSFSGNNADKMLQDINSDGLVDIINTNGSGASTVMINNGHTFNQTTMPFSASSLNFKNDTSSSAFGVNGEASIYFRIYRLLAWVIKIGITFGGGYNLSISESNKSLKDFDGDGYLDFVEKTSEGINYYPSNIKRTNMLKTVNNPLGGSFTMDYTPQKITYDNPHSNWAMTSLLVNDGRNIANDGVDSYSKTFAYENGKYDRRERTFYGYEKVKVIDNSANGVYRVSVSKFHNENYFLAGLVKESYLTKDLNENQIHSKSINTYHIKKTHDDGRIDISTNEPFTYDVGGTEGRRQAAVLLMKTTSELYEYGTTPIVSETHFEYDTYGRVTKFDNKGNVALSQDNYFSEITYHTLNNNILSVPEKITVTQAGATVRLRETTSVNPNTGDILEIKTKLNASDSAVTKMTYNQYGNLLTVTSPPNHNTQSMVYTYGYDPLFKYVTSIADSHGYVSAATYDPKFDALLTSTDLSGNTMTYSYDNAGRVTKILAPKEIGNTDAYTIKFEYFNKYSQLPTQYQNCVTSGNFMPFAVTQHYDVEHPTNPIETVTFVDGLARPIQVKKDVEINTVTDASLTPTYVEHMSVSGMVSYDIYGRAIKQFHPKKEIKACTTNFVVNQVSDTADTYFSTVEYDELDRTVKTTSPAPASNISQMQYSLANDYLGNLSIKTKSIVDQNGLTNTQVITESFSDIQGKTIATVNIGGPNGNILTKFVYNAIGELLSYEDAAGLITKYRYDDAGRKIEVVHPDSGMSTYTYDKASNLIKSQTANLIANSESVLYDYDYNRLSRITFPTISGNTNISDVRYEYGHHSLTGPDVNQRGRLVKQVDATGEQVFRYGNMGEMIYNKRIIAAPNLPTRVFETEFDYDSWNRVQRMVYPDGEVLTYAYDKGGNLSKMSGTYGSQPYDYIQRIDYDHFEQRTYIKYGNNTETKYTYTNDLRRLGNLQAKTSSNQLMFNNTYSYDKVGNVLTIDNTAPYNTVTELGGTYSNLYIYDKLNRLTSASGDFTGLNKKGTVNKSNYTLDMEYNDTHGIMLKNQNHNVNNFQTYETTHYNEYHYEPNSHRVSFIANANTSEQDSFEYDENGNTTVHIKADSTNRQMLWDESNRLRVVSDDGDLKHYIYDAAGERILKASSGVEQVFQNGQLVNGGSAVLYNYTTYASAYLVIDPEQQYSKHYYAGSQRIVSKMGEENAEIFNYQEERLSEVGPQPKKTNFDDIRQLQISDLQNRLQKAKLGKAIFKEYKPEEPVTKEEDDELGKENSSKGDNNETQALFTGLYYFHPDHLGTSTYLTDANGNPYQFFLNLPFGETMYEQNSLTENYYNQYKFSGKELDTETGLYYFGARYYNPRISTWYSVDPLAEKFVNFNPYNYCLQNPVNLIDPDGRQARESDGDPPTKKYTVGKYIKLWEITHNLTMTQEQKEDLSRGCIGVTAIELGENGSPNPNLDRSYEDFELAKIERDILQLQIELNPENYPKDARVALFSVRFWSGDKNKFLPDANGKVDMSTYNYEGNGNLIPFDYGLHDANTDRWWHANHSEPNMVVYNSSLEHYSKPLKNFNRQIFCIAITTIPAPKREEEN